MNVGYVHATSWKGNYGFITKLPLTFSPSVFFRKEDMLPASYLVHYLDSHAEGWYNYYQASRHLIVVCFDIKETGNNGKRPRAANVRHILEANKEEFLDNFDIKICRKIFYQIRLIDRHWDDVVSRFPELFIRDPDLVNVFNS